MCETMDDIYISNKHINKQLLIKVFSMFSRNTGLEIPE